MPRLPVDAMRTLGVDLAAQAANTAAAAIEWGGDRATVVSVAEGLDDDWLVRELRESEWSGIDCPVGWPREMVAAVHAYTAEGSWPGLSKDAFRYRRTDRAVIERTEAVLGKRLYPLSVSADRIALAAWRVAGLREAMAGEGGGRFDRAGGDGVFEVYPAAALLLWGLDRRGYKASGKAGQAARASLLRTIEGEAGWLDWQPGLRELCIKSDHALDAVVASLATRAAARELTYPPEDADLEAVRVEGWIHLPSVPLTDLLEGSCPDGLHA